MIKLAFIIQRCGQNIYAGAERLVYQLADNMSDIFEIDILTTTAQDASTWKNHFPEGVEKHDGFNIIRFRVDKLRDPSYVQISSYLELHNDDEKKGLEFIEANGPVSSDFLSYLKSHKSDYDFFIFFGYSYWFTFNGIQITKEKSILFPQAHQEPWLHFKIYEKVFDSSLGYLFQTKAEKSLVLEKFGLNSKPCALVGHGMDVGLSSKHYDSSIKLPSNFILYIGRISAGKGCQELSDFYNRFSDTHDTDLKLIMVGTLEHPISNTRAKIYENLSDNEKFYILSKSTIFVMPSQYESLNLALLESWIFEKPAIVNGKSRVLADHCLDSNGGLYYNNYEEFVECLELVLTKQNLAQELGINGRKYVENDFTWEKTRRKYSEFLTRMIKQIA